LLGYTRLESRLLRIKETRLKPRVPVSQSEEYGLQGRGSAGQPGRGAPKTAGAISVSWQAAADHRHLPAAGNSGNTAPAARSKPDFGPTLNVPDLPGVNPFDAVPPDVCGPSLPDGEASTG
jgi:hypothetical protein